MQIQISGSEYTREDSLSSIGVERVGKKAGWGPGRRPYHIVHYVFKGRGYIDGRAVQAGEGFYMDPEEIHEYHSSEEDPWQYIWAVFEGTSDAEFLDKMGINTDNPIFTHCVDENFVSIYEMIDKRWNLYPSASFRRGLFDMFLSFIVKAETEDDAFSKGERYVRQAIEYMENNYHENIKMTDVAKSLWLDEGYLYNLFKKHTGISPKEYLNKLRINIACDLLIHSDMQICEVSRSVGYGDSLQFSRFFKQHKGDSPISYRKKARLEKAESPTEFNKTKVLYL